MHDNYPLTLLNCSVHGEHSSEQLALHGRHCFGPNLRAMINSSCTPLVLIMLVTRSAAALVSYEMVVNAGRQHAPTLYSGVTMSTVTTFCCEAEEMSDVELRHMSNNENIEIVPPVRSPLPSYRVRHCSTKKCKCDAHSALYFLFVRQ